MNRTRLLALVLAALAFGQSSRAAQAQPRDFVRARLGVSPDARSSVEFAETAQHQWVYRWVENNPRRLLLEMPSSYQPEDDGQGRWSRDKLRFAREVAGLSWSADGRFLAIDESVLRMSGTILVAERLGAGRARQIVIPEWKIREGTGERWARGRLWLARDGAPIKGGELKVRLVGWIYDKSKAHPEIEPPLHHACAVLLHLTRLGASQASEPGFTIESCQELSP